MKARKHMVKPDESDRLDIPYGTIVWVVPTERPEGAPYQLHNVYLDKELTQFRAEIVLDEDH